MTPKEEAKGLILKFTFLKTPESDNKSAIKMYFPSNYKYYEYWLEVEKELTLNK